jgi:hypothetical protein
MALIQAMRGSQGGVPAMNGAAGMIPGMGAAGVPAGTPNLPQLAQMGGTMNNPTY